MQATPHAGVTAADGTVLAATTWVAGSGAPTILAVHATGFCKEVFGPVVAELAGMTPDFSVLAADQRGHGDSGTSEPPFDWWDLGRDCLAMLGGRHGVLGLGHSSGGAALVMAELLAPGTFSALLLVEPILFPRPADTALTSSLAGAARRRKHRFDSPEAAMQNWKSRGPFRLWDDRALEAYARGGLRRSGAEWVLKCEPETEAQSYLASTTHNAFERLGEIGATVHLMAGEHSDTHRPELVDATTERIAQATAEIVAGATHFVPMERPALVARRTAAMVDQGLHRARR